MKQKTAIFFTFVLAVLLISMVLGYYFFLINIAWRLTSPRLMVIAGFKDGSHIYLYQSGFQDRDVSLCIPLAQGFTKIKRIASWRYSEFDAICSKDRSVIAFELNDYFVAAYDFKTRDAITITKTYHRDGTEPTSNSKDVDIEITNLINSRGGIGNVIPCTYDTYVGMTYKDWKKFQEGLKAGEQDDIE